MSRRKERWKERKKGGRRKGIRKGLGREGKKSEKQDDGLEKERRWR